METLFLTRPRLRNKIFSLYGQFAPLNMISAREANPNGKDEIFKCFHYNYAKPRYFLEFSYMHDFDACDLGMSYFTMKLYDKTSVNNCNKF